MRIILQRFLILGLVVVHPLMVLSQSLEPTIVIDPGHGGSAYLGSQKEQTLSSPNNAKSPSGIKEKDLTLEFSLILEATLLALAKESGRPVKVVLTRREDVNLDFKERAGICAAASPSAIVSIHFNASTSGKALGTLCVIRNARVNEIFAADKTFAEGLSEACNRGVRKYLPDSKSKGAIEDAYLHRGMGSNFFFQLSRHANLRRVPKCFLEVEHIDRSDVEKRLLQPRQETFPTIAREIATYLLDYVSK